MLPKNTTYQIGLASSWKNNIFGIFLLPLKIPFIYLLSSTHIAFFLLRKPRLLQYFKNKHSWISSPTVKSQRNLLCAARPGVYWTPKVNMSKHTATLRPMTYPRENPYFRPGRKQNDSLGQSLLTLEYTFENCCNVRRTWTDSSSVDRKHIAIHCKRSQRSLCFA